MWSTLNIAYKKLFKNDFFHILYQKLAKWYPEERKMTWGLILKTNLGKFSFTEVKFDQLCEKLAF